MILAIIGVLAVLGLIGLRFYNQAQRDKQDKADRDAMDQALTGIETMAAVKRNTNRSNVPNATTREAIAELETGNGKRVANVAELMTDLESKD